MVTWVMANLTNIVVVGIVLILMVLAGRSVWQKRGSCDCGGSCHGECGCSGGCNGSCKENAEELAKFKRIAEEKAKANASQVH